MTSAIRARREAESGFTLIELLVVVIIIGILAAIAIPAFLNQRERAWQAELTSAVRNVALEIEAEATAFGGDYSDVDTGAANTDLGDFADAELTSLGADDVTFANDGNGFEVSASAFTICMSHSLITGANSVSYDSANGGLQEFTDAACDVDGVA